MWYLTAVSCTGRATDWPTIHTDWCRHTGLLCYTGRRLWSRSAVDCGTIIDHFVKRSKQALPTTWPTFVVRLDLSKCVNKHDFYFVFSYSHVFRIVCLLFIRCVCSWQATLQSLQVILSMYSREFGDLHFDRCFWMSLFGVVCDGNEQISLFRLFSRGSDTDIALCHENNAIKYILK